MSIDNMMKLARKFEIKLAQEASLEQLIAKYEVDAASVFEQIYSFVVMVFDKKPTLKNEFIKNYKMIKDSFYKILNVFKKQPTKSSLNSMWNLINNFTNWSKREEVKSIPEPYRSSFIEGIENCVNRFWSSQQILNDRVK